MRLTHLTNKRVIVARRITDSNDRLIYATVTAQMMNIQPSGNSANQIAEGTFGKAFRLYCDGAVDVQPGDRLRDDDGVYYTVISDGVTRRTMGSMDYTILSVQKV